mgnify:CR=1 FL=1
MIGESAPSPVVLFCSDDLEHGGECAVLLDGCHVSDVNNVVVEVDKGSEIGVFDEFDDPDVDGHAVEVG